MLNDSFYHNSQDSFYRHPFGAVCCGQSITIRFKICDENFPVGQVRLRLWVSESSEEIIVMDMAKGCMGERIYQAEINTPQEPGLIWYYFIIHSLNEVYYYGNNPQKLGGLGSLYKYQPDAYQITVYKEGYKTPSWFKDSIMYQILVDRFYNGNENGKVNNPKKNSHLYERWDDIPEYKPDPETGEITCSEFFGGNFKGVIEKLPYLKELGVSVIYFNPIFESPSSHKYNTGDYMKIDSMYGDEDIFLELISTAKSMGISIILDGVFSHTGSDSKYFNKEGNYPVIGAYQSTSSPYYSWYNFRHYPDDYTCWWGVKTLPEVNELEQSYQNFILGNDESVINHWMRFGIKGWRLDVADELPDEFLKKLRKSIKEFDDDAVIIGEVWEDASNKISYGRLKQYLLGEELDSVMNYRLKDGILDFLIGKCSGEYLNRVIMSLYENYPLQSFYSLMNILGTHDTCRALYVLAGIECGDGIHSKEKEAAVSLTPEQMEIAGRRMKMASAFIMTFPGVPCIYYGDEAGLGGSRDPFNRRAYPWERENKELLEWYKKICLLRQSMNALQTGEYFPIYYSEDAFGFVRVINKGTDIFNQRRNKGFVLALFNRSQNLDIDIIVDLRKWSIPRLFNILDNKSQLVSNDGCFNIRIPALECLILADKIYYGTN